MDIETGQFVFICNIFENFQFENPRRCLTLNMMSLKVKTQ